MNKIQQTAQGLRILHEWLGQGAEPVPLEEAQARANTCLGCPKNYQGLWLWKKATALAIASQMRLRHAMQIELAGEEKLGVCEVCGCQLRLKVHVPFVHIHRHTSDEMFSHYPDFCWQQKELQRLKTQP